MMAAAARTSGTCAPVASVLYRGVIASCSDRRLRRRACSRARTAARAWASLDLRDLDAVAEYAVFFFAAVRRAGFDFCAAASALATGRNTATPSRAVRRRTTTRGRIKRTNPPEVIRPNGRLGATGWY